MSGQTEEGGDAWGGGCRVGAEVQGLAVCIRVQYS